QAEDGIRDFHVTGVQTCALPIFDTAESLPTGCAVHVVSPLITFARHGRRMTRCRRIGMMLLLGCTLAGCADSRREPARVNYRPKIGRASCRERVLDRDLVGRVQR